MKVAVIGSRTCDVSLEYVISHIPGGCTTIISGGAKGIDKLAAEASALLGCELVEFFPDYEQFGRRAPLLRNLDIIQSADLVLAFWDMQSPGTRYALDQCIKLQVPARLIRLK